MAFAALLVEVGLRVVIDTGHRELIPGSTALTSFRAALFQRRLHSYP